MIAPKNPNHVKWSEVTHLGSFVAKQTNTFFSILFKMEF
jgi:hypothetical protein